MESKRRGNQFRQRRDPKLANRGWDLLHWGKWGICNLAECAGCCDAAVGFLNPTLYGIAEG